jgi:protein SCO1/2
MPDIKDVNLTMKIVSLKDMAKKRKLIIAALGCMLFIAGCSKAKPPGVDVGTKLDMELPSDIANLPLVDSNGKKTSLADFRGKVLVISDTMTLCEESCPLDTANLVQTAREVDKADHGSDVVFLSITVDPQRDTVPQIEAYRKLFAPLPANWQVLTGTPENIHKLWKFFGVYWVKQKPDSPDSKNWRTGEKLTYDIGHSDEIFFLGRTGHERYILEGAGNVQPGTPLPKTMHDYLSDEGIENLEHPSKQTWTVPQALQTIAWLRGTR